MYNHLNNKKKPCPALVQNITLTTEIIQYILDNCIWKPPITQEPTTPQTVIQVNNYHNQILNIVNKMDMVEKVTKYIEYKGLEPRDIDEHIYETHRTHINGLETDKYFDFHLDEKGILQAIDNITLYSDVSRISVIHDTLSDRLKIFEDGQWSSMIFDAGVDKLMSKLQDSYLEVYELFLLKRYYKGNAFVRQQSTERLKDYYRFIVCFNLDPYIKEKTDGDIMDSGVEAYTLADRFYTIFGDIKESIRYSDVRRTRQQISSVIKNNHKANVLEVNMKVLELMNTDSQFKQLIFDKLQPFGDSGISHHDRCG